MTVYFFFDYSIYDGFLVRNGRFFTAQASVTATLIIVQLASSGKVEFN
jgi:hypothetical protein